MKGLRPQNFLHFFRAILRAFNRLLANANFRFFRSEVSIFSSRLYNALSLHLLFEAAHELLVVFIFASYGINHGFLS